MQRYSNAIRVKSTSTEKVVSDLQDLAGQAVHQPERPGVVWSLACQSEYKLAPRLTLWHWYPHWSLCLLSSCTSRVPVQIDFRCFVNSVRKYEAHCFCSQLASSLNLCDHQITLKWSAPRQLTLEPQGLLISSLISLSAIFLHFESSSANRL